MPKQYDKTVTITLEKAERLRSMIANGVSLEKAMEALFEEEWPPTPEDPTA